jgi:methyltransferase (TIGR00027 family)
MQATGYSWTAEFMALFRALETATGPKGRLFDDPWAIGFLRPSLRVVAWLSRVAFLNSSFSRFIDGRWPGARTSGVARTRYIDEALCRALSEGITQVAILGAGFDSRACRLAALSKAIVFEVDHPNTLRMKQRHLQRFLGKLPLHVRYVAMDFNRQSLGMVLGAAGLDLGEPIFFLWEGVTQYLTADAVDATFRFIATAAPRSEILFTYVHADAVKEKNEFNGITALNRTLKKAAEPWMFGFEPRELPRYLANRGLKLVSDLSAVDYRALYAGDRRLNNTGYEFYRAAIAVVRSPQNDDIAVSGP